ncbi:hypothetical protein, partial [Klebsiella pneumoniae]|uniref:hypothetical protein n=1 Tax=Klebsiella pneumoniae TaxID=573 RepID=UPI001EFA4CD7
KRAYCLKTQPATGETYPKSDLFNKADRRWICEVTFSTENYGRSLSFSRIHSLFTLGCNDIYRLETS